MIKNSYKAFIFLSLVFCFSISHAIFLRSKLPAYGLEIGSYLDDVSYAMVVSLILIIIFNLPSLLRKVSLFMFVFLIQFMVFGQWWNYEFYRDYIHYASFGVSAGFDDIARGFEGFQSRNIAISGFVVFLIVSFILEKFSGAIRTPIKTRLIIMVIGLIVAVIPTATYTQYYKLSQVENWYRTEKIPLNYKNPVLQLFREKFIDKTQKAKITTEHQKEINQLYNNENSIYPFYRNEKKKTAPKRYNVIYIILESVRKYETIAEKGIDLTPNFNRISANNFTPKYYYANSNQTIKAEIALLCGIHDFLIGSSISAANNQQVKANCIPQMLKQNGYQTFWFHGAESNFFNRNQFLPKIGFDELHDQPTIQHRLYKQQKPYVLRHWGVEDPYTFKYAFDYLKSVQQPFFAEILSVSNHHPFVDMDTNNGEPYFHPDIPRETEDIYNRYQHMTHYTDAALGQFWQSFKESSLYDTTVVVISGDHGIWLFPDEDKSTESSKDIFKYESYLRLPLTIYFPDKSFSNTIDTELSQVDVPNIIASYMGLHQPNAFQSKLSNSDISNLLDPSKIVEKISNPIFSLIGDNFYYRYGNVICYPPLETDQDCDDYLRRCIDSHNTLRTDKHCVSVEGDLLNKDMVKVTNMTNYNTKTLNIAVDYFRKAINYGMMPETSIMK